MEEKQEVIVEFVGLFKSEASRGRFSLPVSAVIGEALEEVRSFIESKKLKMSYTIYLNGTFITRSSVKNSDLRVRQGDVFKVFPIMGGG